MVLKKDLSIVLIRFHLNGQKIKLKMKQKKLIGPCQLTRLKIFIDFKERSESIRTYGPSKTIFDHMDANDIGKL